MLIHILTFRVQKEKDELLDYIKELAKESGHEIKFIYAQDCFISLNGKPKTVVKDVPLEEIKILISRADFSGKYATFHASLIAQFEIAGIKVLNKHDAILNAKDKLRTLQILTKHNVPIPKTFLVRSSEQLPEIVKELGNPPYILKGVYGAQGRNVFIIESLRSLKSISEIIIGTKDYPPILIQEYIKEAEGKDIRAFTVGEKVVASMERSVATTDEFRSNYSLGGNVKQITLTEEEEKISINAAKACGLDIAGVDIIRSANGPKILEVNANPGIEGIIQATGINVIKEILDFAEKKTNE